MLDVRLIVSTTYTIEGDGLVILLAWQLVETVRKMGRELMHEGTLPNVEAVLRSSAPLTVGLVLVARVLRHCAPR